MSFVKYIGNSFRNSGSLIQLIIINAVVFVALNILSESSLVIENTEAYYLSVSDVPLLFLYHFWGLFTHMFVHFELGHIFFNLLCLFFMGQIFNLVIGKERLVFVYIMGGLAGGLLFFITGNILPFQATLLHGASSSIMAIAVSSAFYAPEMPVQLMLFGEARLKWVVLILFILTSVIDIASNSGGKVAHIGGALFGMAFALRYKKGHDLSLRFSRLFSLNTKNRLKVVHKRRINDEEYNMNRVEEQRMLDEILDKINRSGYESLSSKDKETLHRLSQKK